MPPFRLPKLWFIAFDYPWHRVFVHVLDTQTDGELARLAGAVPCEYHACDDSHTVLSQVLRQGEGIGEYILLLQAGHLPDPDILRQALPYFEPDVAYVQTELRSIERPVVDHPLLQLIPMGVTGGDAAPCLGSGAIIRRQALAALHNADWLMPVRLGSYLHQAGWRSHLCRETGVSGGLLLFRNR
ncbi:MAG: cellulose synthase, partial [Synechococcaceae cyanobacterium SM2_3_60]|nr:cellulose synthase [Synechococcaceae cyanobacterium SM2_3_60]